MRVPTLRQLLRERRGSNVVEFALTLPVFVMIVIGIIDYGYLFAVQSGIHNAAAMGCREGAMVDPAFGSPTTTASSMISTMGGLWCQSGCLITVNDLNSGTYAVPNRTLECQIVKNFVPLVGFGPMPAVVETTSQYRFEWQRSP